MSFRVKEGTTPANQAAIHKTLKDLEQYLIFQRTENARNSAKTILYGLLMKFRPDLMEPIP